jgi:hypothetical protein
VLAEWGLGMMPALLELINQKRKEIEEKQMYFVILNFRKQRKEMTLNSITLKQPQLINIWELFYTLAL